MRNRPRYASCTNDSIVFFWEMFNKLNETFYFTTTINIAKETWIQGDSDQHNENIVRIQFTKIHCNHYWTVFGGGWMMWPILVQKEYSSIYRLFIVLYQANNYWLNVFFLKSGLQTLRDYILIWCNNLFWQ